MSDHNRRTACLALVAGAVLVTWIVIARLLVPPFIEHAYHGTAPAVVSDLLPRRKRLPLEHYLARSERITLTISILLALGGLGLVAVSRPGVQRHLDRRPKPSTLGPPETAGCLPLHRRRLLVVNAVIAVGIGGHLFDIVTGTEHWPFSHYGMFSGLAPRHLSAKLNLYGVTEAGDVRLNIPGYVAPLDDQRIRGTILKLQRRPDARPALERVLRYSGDRYERLRRMGAHDGPPILGVKLVEVSWTQDEWAQNKQSPDSLRVLYEVRLSDGED